MSDEEGLPGTVLGNFVLVVIQRGVRALEVEYSRKLRWTMETMDGPVNASDAESGVRRPMRTRSLERGQEKGILQNRGSLRAVAVLMNCPRCRVQTWQ